jgi:mannose-6-phosphate isomerase
MAKLSSALFVKPIFMERVWGGNRLGRLLGKELAPGKIIGESWELADRPEAQSLVCGGAFDGVTVRQLLKERPEELLGKLAAAHPKNFPLLIKYIDAGADLSVQVHPDDAQAARFNDLGKAECWVVVHAEPNAKFIRGLKPGTTREIFERAMAAGKVEEVLHSFAAKAGQVLALPPGMVHAIGAGIVVAEIQQNSDLTFRLYDYNRLGLDGKPRPLHVKDALAVMRFDAPGDEFAGDLRADTMAPLKSERRDGVLLEDLLQSCFFNLQRHSLARGKACAFKSQDLPRVLMAISGSGTLDGKPVTAGQTVLIPAAAADISCEAGKESSLVLLSSIPCGHAADCGLTAKL